MKEKKQFPDNFKPELTVNELPTWFQYLNLVGRTGGKKKLSEIIIIILNLNYNKG